MSYKLQLIQDGVVKYEIAEGERKKVAVGTYTVRLVRDGEVLKEETVNIDVGQIFFYGYKIETVEAYVLKPELITGVVIPPGQLLEPSLTVELITELVV